ncbi:MAG TPA: DUF255 domain-containing protein [Saprospiraceae bacterium]|nr:DUF255 domain-containing protein [Saprospiraceae bacterium]
MKFYIYAFFAMLIFCNISCKEGGSGGSEYEIKSNEITWLNLEQAEDLENGVKKMYFLDLYTSWCGWCKVMDRETFTNAEIIKYMNEHFHNVKFDAEQKEQATFDGKKYDWVAGGRNGVNQLAVELLQGDLSYPSYVVLDENKKLLKTFKGFMEAESFLQVIKSVVP